MTGRKETTWWREQRLQAEEAEAARDIACLALFYMAENYRLWKFVASGAYCEWEPGMGEHMGRRLVKR